MASAIAGQQPLDAISSSMSNIAATSTQGVAQAGFFKGTNGTTNPSIDLDGVKIYCGANYD